MTGKGSVDTCLVHPAEIYRACLLTNSHVFATAHNHPSGDPRPSPDDLRLQDRLQAGGDILGLRYLDNLIVGAGGRYWSAKEAGRL
jgi:DNA repair protein RadC